MKLSTKIILPIILISALLISLSGCIPTTTPSPGVTTEGGTITGIFEVPEACCYSNRDHTEGWVPLVDATVSVIDSKGVTHTTKTDSDGKYWLTDVAPGIYYVVTACCACEDMEGVYKDVVEELKEGETYNAGIADCESTALGLMVDFLLSGDVYVDEDCNYYCNCFDEDSQIYASLVTVGTKLRALAINLQSIPEKPLEEIKANADFQAFVVELCDLLEACCVEPGVTPIPPPIPPPPGYYNLYLKANPWEGAKSLTGAGAYLKGLQNVAVNTEANPCYLFKFWTVDVGNPSLVTGGLTTEPLEVDMNEDVTLTAHFECPPCGPDLVIDIGESTKGTPADVSICVPDCATINSVTVNGECEDVFPIVLEPPYDPEVLTFGYDDTNISFDYETGEICFIGEETLLPYIATIVVTYTNPCGDEAATGTVYVEFKGSPIADAGPDQFIQLGCESEVLVSFDGSGSSGTGLTYDWDFGDLPTDPHGTIVNPSHTYSAGTYTVTLTVTNDCGSTTDTTTVTITECINTAPKVEGLPTRQAISAVTYLGSCIPTYRFTVGNYASDDEGDILTYSLVGDEGVNYPTGMTIDPDSGEIVWDPYCVDIGERCYECGLVCVTVSVQDDGCCQPSYTDVKICIEVWDGLIDGGTGGTDVGKGFDGCPIDKDNCP